MVPRTIVPVCNCRRGFFALQCHKFLSPLQTGLQKGIGLDGTPLHEHEETIVSRVRMQAGIVKARSAGDSVKEKQKKKPSGAGIVKARGADDSVKEKEKKPRRRNRRSAKRGRFRKGKTKEKAKWCRNRKSAKRGRFRKEKTKEKSQEVQES